MKRSVEEHQIDKAGILGPVSETRSRGVEQPRTQQQQPIEAHWDCTDQVPSIIIRPVPFDEGAVSIGMVGKAGPLQLFWRKWKPVETR